MQLGRRLSSVGFPASHERSQFEVPVSGIYWLSFRAHSDSQRPPGLSPGMAVHVDGEVLVEAASDRDSLGTSSAAYWLGHRSLLTVRVRSPQTLHQRGETGNAYLSVVYLSGNRAPYTGAAKHIAYTGMVDLAGPPDPEDLTVSFGNPVTNLGELYGAPRGGEEGGARTVSVRVPGLYLVSVRIFPNPPGLPVAQMSLRLERGCLQLYAPGEVGTTYTMAIALAIGTDVVYVDTPTASWVDKRTMLSVAFLAAHN